MKLTINKNVDPLLVCNGIEYRGQWHPVQNVAVWRQWPTPSSTVSGIVVIHTVEFGEAILELEPVWVPKDEDLCFVIKDLTIE